MSNGVHKYLTPEFWILNFLSALLLCASPVSGAEKSGGIVLQFDDGWSSWNTFIAPELKKVGGVATFFVNNQNLRSGRITVEDLLTIQNTYGNEIGSHTWHHLNAPSFVRKNGLERWLSEEFHKSVTELRAMGLTIRSLVFPFNAFDKTLAQAVGPQVETFRRADRLALANRISADKSVPGTAIDMAHYTPTDLMRKWIDLAAERDMVLFLYGHRVLPDSFFATGTVVSVTRTTITANVEVTLPQGTDLVLVPDDRRRSDVDSFNVIRASGKVIEVDRADLTTHTEPGAHFIVGEAYSLRYSDFKVLIDYAASKLNFYTLHDISQGKHLSGKN